MAHGKLTAGALAGGGAGLAAGPIGGAAGAAVGWLAAGGLGNIIGSGKKKAAPKPAPFYQQHPALLIGGGLALAAVVYLAVRK